jgi:hypothetical protein
LVGVQVPPVVHGPQTPLWHAMLFPQDSPFMMLLVSTHTGLPVEHEIVPFLHRFVGWQAAPSLQVLHVPPLQTLFVPHNVPFMTFPDSPHTAVPVEQEIIPVLHGFVGWQLAPLLQMPHVPLLQTLLEPQEVPLETFPVSTHTDVPVEHDVVPVLQGLAGWQPTFAAHTEQPPLLHTMLVPHDVPFVTLPVSVQTGAPVSQTIAPVRHGLPLTVQVAPVWQVMQVPATLHTLFVPQLVPAATAVPLSVQTGVPVEQASVPW